ncbi:hypothetical protein LIS90_13615 [Flavobacterium psychrophilum]|uniref:DUF6984 family protein n=1 Tax=Flavobacterium psychrophilum TaxID=96345 RepID=UPI0018896C1C|nr:hypothetical protein [Flavobacterium psychrophilum]MBF2092874.1 hypothetical protein [Flavobacterium psychrophilum]MCB6232284.1 hypothetical protein [Flavobacterium psychrophilum]
MNIKRKLTLKEELLIDFLIKKSNVNNITNWKNKIVATPMADGGMGSLKLYSTDNDKEDRLYGSTISEYQYKDIDGIDVIASLNLDKNNNLFELDIWKVDFSELLSLPDLDLQ